MGLNQTEFGKILGVSMRAVQSWEAGERNMPETTAKLLNQIKSTHSSYVSVETTHTVNELPTEYLRIKKSNKEELFQHYSKLLKKVNKSIEDLENDVEGLDGYKQLSELIKLKAEIQKDLDSL